MHHRRTTSVARALFVAVALLAGACGADDGTATTTTVDRSSATTTAPVERLTVLVTNDDGIGAPGIDALVNALRARSDLDVVVVAPAENQSGSSDKTTPGGAAHREGTTASGVVGTAVEGFPADAVTVALDVLGVEPDVVVSGINEGQNTGPLAYVSGTVGAARTAARRGIPAIAGSAGLGEAADYELATTLVVDWLDDNADALRAGAAGAETVTSINVPACTLGGAVKDEVLEVPLAAAVPEGVDPFQSDCSTVPPAPPGDDVAALAAGHPAETQVPLEAP